MSIDPNGKFHAFQVKDEDINLDELRKIRAQVNELVEIPIVHPRVPPGSPHLAHLVTSGLFNEVATAQIRASNEGWAAKGLPTVEPIDRNSLIPRFVAMSDEFWPEKPADIREFFSFYLAEGCGDFDSKKIGGLLHGLLLLTDEPERRKVQRLAAVGFPPPRVSADEILTELFSATKPTEKNRRSPDPWSLEALIHFIARRNDRPFLSNYWRAISKLDMISFQPSPKVDGLLWDAPDGHEADRKPEKEQSWAKLRQAASDDRSNELPDVLRENPEFALMYFLAYPHRISIALVGFLDQHFGKMM